ncbi:hypothetical protein Bca52824_089286 [Brassica carinata]|uniref:Uncharacterized protein n=1 Tax=Brassica carinata TaxID=52824 RepID=A0A8X7PEZ8_BRACI|nr:hypothetical protein Bca52824_089286 [Brassica carinata]
MTPLNAPKAAADPAGQGRFEGRDPRRSGNRGVRHTRGPARGGGGSRGGLKETPPSSPRKRRRTSPDHRSRKRARKVERKGDPEDECYGYPLRRDGVKGR